MKIIPYTAFFLFTSATFSLGAFHFFDNQASWLTNAGATAADMSSQNYDSASGPIGTVASPTTFTTSGGTAGSVTYTLGVDPSRNVSYSTVSSFVTGTTGQGIYLTTPARTGLLTPARTDVAVMTVSSTSPADVFSFSFNAHDLFDTASGLYGFKVDVKLAGAASETVFQAAELDGMGAIQDYTISAIGGNASATIDYEGPGGVIGSIVMGDDSNANVGEDGTFFGFTSSTKIESITLTKTTYNDGNDNWSFDQFNVVSTAAVPEPSAILLTLLASSLFLARRDRTST